MRIYQTEESKRWILPPYYRQTIYFIKSYYVMKEEHNDIIDNISSPSIDGQPHGTGISDPTAIKAQRAEELYDNIKIIENALKIVPEKYRDVIWANVMFNKPYKDLGMESASTYRDYRYNFIRKVAEDKKIIEKF